MINKKLKTLIATLVITSLSSNVAFAEIMNLRNPDIEENASPETSQKIDIVKSLKEDVEISIETFSKELYSTGRPDNGSKGVTIAAAYLTPNKTFGYMYVENYDYNGTGTVKIENNVSSSNSIFAGRSPTQGTNPNNLMYDFAKSLFINKNLNAYTSIRDASEDGIKNGDYLIQEANDGRKFIASTFYVRYTYDIPNGDSNRTKLYEKPNPILPISFTNGPYLAMGDFFDETMDVVTNSSSRDTIINNQTKYLKPLKDILGVSSIPSGIIGLTLNDGFVKENGSFRVPTKRAVLEKRYEYRRYVKNDVILVDNPAEYEFVYAIKNNTTKSQSVLPDISPKLSINSSTEYTDSSKGSISKYAFDVEIYTRNKEPGNTYTKDFQNYTIRKVSDRPSDEPREDQMDLWHSDLTATFDIIDSSGRSRLNSPKSIPAYDSTVYIYPDDIKPNDNGSKLLDDCTAKVTLNFRNNARFMAHKEVYAYRYTQQGEVKTYDEIISYIDKKETGLQLKTDIANYQTSTDPREELIYKTETSRTRTIEATAGILSIVAGDYANATVTVGVTPPNTLTVLEGGIFTANININTNGVPIGYNGSDTWITDFKIDELLITSASGDVIHKENNIIINPTTLTTIDKQVSNLTAKPTHIGVASVKVTYSYTINKQTYRKVPIDEPGRVDSNGDMTWDYNLVKNPLEQLHQNGTADNTFNIYSLSGNTVS